MGKVSLVELSFAETGTKYQGKSIMSEIYGEQWGLVLLLSFLFTWGVGLAPPLLIRFVFMRRPIGKGWAVGLVVLFLLFNIGLFTALGSQSKTHFALYLVAIVSYMILNRGIKNKNIPQQDRRDVNRLTMK